MNLLNNRMSRDTGSPEKNETKKYTKENKMPGGDRSGPLGDGPKTGRSAGFCTGNRMPGSMNLEVHNLQGNAFRGAGRGGMPWGGGRGRAWGGGRGFWGNQATYETSPNSTPPPDFSPPETSREEEIVQLKEQAKIMAMTMKGLEKKLAELSNVDE